MSCWRKTAESSDLAEGGELLSWDDGVKEKLADYFAGEVHFGWRPFFTRRFVSCFSLAFGVIFVIIGIICISASKAHIECSLEYDSKSVIIDSRTFTHLHCKNTSPSTKVMKGPVYIYYELRKFVQNDTDFVQSRFDRQLQGEVVLKREEVLKHCGPKNSFVNNDNEYGKILHPCGAYPRSFFNDSIRAVSHTTNYEQKDYKISRQPTDIAWPADLAKFKQPSLEERIEHAHEVDFWLEGDDEGTFNGDDKEAGEGVENAYFVSWMTTAPLPNFRNLWGVIEEDLSLPFTATIETKYHVERLGVHKYIVFSQATFAGASVMFIGLCYVVLAVVLFIVGIFLFIWKGKIEKFA
eukprot:GHVS01091815.1.p1 GENE.GHVS01091815.1~~GHVS01091815.1.p1  ORF type:complete len:352 (-),score=41.68 GHVS01091815.1:147-1202(-)